MKRQIAFGSLLLVALVLMLAFLLWGGTGAFLQAREAARRASCRPELVLDTCRRFARDHEGMFPPLAPVPGMLMFDGDACPVRWPMDEYVCDADDDAPSRSVLKKAAVPDDWSYVYLGYFLEDETQGLAFVDAYRKWAATGGSLPEGLAVPEGKGNLGGTALLRLRESDVLPEKLRPMAEKAAQLPVVVEWPGHHNPMGGHGVFLDGHREYIEFPGRFPMSASFIDGLRALDALPPKH